jgi:hypothetical protein
MNGLSQRRPSAMLLPIQAPPIRRDEHTGALAPHAEGGLAANQSACSSLRGLARQMCYATTYGVSV